MKIEIRKRTDYQGDYYFIYQDNKLIVAAPTIEKAQTIHDDLVAKAGTEEVWETVKETTI